jgi:hypothetical protein
MPVYEPPVDSETKLVAASEIPRDKGSSGKPQWNATGKGYGSQRASARPSRMSMGRFEGEQAKPTTGREAFLVN